MNINSKFSKTFAAASRVCLPLLVLIVYVDRLWIIGGFDNLHRANFDDAWWTEDGIKWQHLDTKTRFSSRHEVTAYVYDKSLWVVAGNSWPLRNDVWKLKPPIERSEYGEDVLLSNRG